MNLWSLVVYGRSSREEGNQLILFSCNDFPWMKIDKSRKEANVVDKDGGQLQNMLELE